jgi:3-dehydroquinate dehydratase / shikimate dehydrogenase
MFAPRLCVSLTAATTAELRRKRDATTDADLIELRLDSVQDPDPQGALAGRAQPVIVTCRPVWEGGAFGGSEEERKRILVGALDAGAEYVDVEWKAGFADLVRLGGRRVLLSTHDFEGVPTDLAARVQAMRADRPGIVKVAVTAKRLSDTLPLLDLAARARAEGAGESVWIAMGAPGLSTRILAARFGSCLTYAGDGVAPGQIPSGRLLKEFGFRRITAETSVYGVVGSPVGHSVSPAMHNAAFQASGLDAVYVPLEAENVDDFERVAEVLDIRGASVTVPFKVPFFERVMARSGSEALDPLCQRVGAINTLRRAGEGWQGRNTDVAGFLAPLTGRMTLQGARAAVLGAGGAARAVAVALVSAGAHVSVHARHIERAADVVRSIGGVGCPLPPAGGTWDLLVNATPVGMSPRIDETPWPNATFDGRVVYDLVYNPVETRFIREARAAGCFTIGGLDMLIAQAQEQAEWWTGIRPSAECLRDAARAALGLSEAEEPARQR